MKIYQAILLGIIQGITEFLPISSSGHLNIIPWLFNWSIPESFDVALHFGTLFAVVLYFLKDWIRLIRGGYNLVVKKEKTFEGKMFWYLVAATIPGALIGFVLDKLFENNLAHAYLLIGFAFVVMGTLLYVVDKKCPKKRKFNQITFKDAMIIGTSQCLAFIPGVSRSGVTTIAGRLLGLKRETIAKFTFLLSTPIIAAATILKIAEFEFTFPFILGILISFIVGFCVIKFFMNYLKKGNYKIFAIYRVVFGIIIIVTFIIRHIK